MTLVMKSKNVCLLYLPVISRGENRGGGTKGQINTLTNITGKKKRKNDFKKEGEGTQNFFLDRKTNPFESKELPET